MPVRIPARRSKYRAIPEYVDGVRFASKKEAKRFRDLKLLQSRGFISGLRLQPEYTFEINGTKVFTYRADFAYNEKTQTPIGGVWLPRVEDCKGYRTAIYKLKKRLIEAHCGIKILET